MLSDTGVIKKAGINFAFHLQGECIIYSRREDQDIRTNLTVGSTEKVMLNFTCVMWPVSVRGSEG